MFPSWPINSQPKTFTNNLEVHIPCLLYFRYTHSLVEENDSQVVQNKTLVLFSDQILLSKVKNIDLKALKKHCTSVPLFPHVCLVYESTTSYFSQQNDLSKLSYHKSIQQIRIRRKSGHLDFRCSPQFLLFLTCAQFTPVILLDGSNFKQSKKLQLSSFGLVRKGMNLSLISKFMHLLIYLLGIICSPLSRCLCTCLSLLSNIFIVLYIFTSELL